MKIKIFTLVVSLTLMIAGQALFAQTDAERQRIISNTNVSFLKEFAVKKEKEAKEDKAKALKLAGEKGLKEKYTENGRFFSLMRVTEDGTPIYYSTNNVDAARSTRTNFLHNGGGLGLNIEGQGMTTYIWDGGHGRTTHQEYDGAGGTNRLTILDPSDPDAGLNFHAAHVTGTMIASGFVANAKGMAPQAYCKGYEWNDDVAEVTSEAAAGMLVSNHSYGYVASGIPDGWFGQYGQDAVDFDGIMYNAPYYLMVVAAGNDGDDNTSNGVPLDGNTLYDKLSGHATAKNNLVIANAQDATIEGGELISVTINSSSSEGPTDDYRIKPDITANGTELYSTYETADDIYASITGTSMASPNTTGTLLILQQYYNSLYANYMRAATLKGLVLHTADDAGTAGPDAVYGWGLLNAKKAAETITNNEVETIIRELTLTQGSSYNINVTASGIEDLKASICWTDPAGTLRTGTNDKTPVLKNDLDIRITQSASTYYPFKLTSITTNTTGDNIVDPYERINIASPTCGTVYTITVSHKGTLTASQNYTLIVTGIKSATTDASLVSAKPQGTSCDYSNNTSIDIKVANLGSTTLSNVLVVWEVRKADNSLVGNGNYTIGSIAACNSNTTTVYADMSINGEIYTISTNLSVTGDENSANNSYLGQYSPVNVDLSTPGDAYSTSFEAGSLEAIGWSQEDVNGDGGQGIWYIYQDAGFAHTGTGFAIQFAGAGDSHANDWIYSPCLYLKAGQNYSVSYWVRMIQSKPETIKLCIGTSPTAASMTTTLTAAYTPTTSWVQKTQTFTVPSDNVYYLGWHSYNMTDAYAPTLDDINISNTSVVVLPQVTTGTVASITGTSADGSGEVTNIGSSVVTERGIVYRTTINPTTADNKVISGSGLGVFSGVLMSPLTSSTTYYVRAYAINSSGTAYGDNVSFTTLAGPPSITGVSITSFFKDKGATITIDGTDLLNATSVNIAGIEATINTNTATSISATFPAGVYSNNTLTVTTASGSDTYTMSLQIRNTIPVGGGTDYHTTIQSALDGLFAWYGATSFDAGQLAGTKTIDVYAGTYAEQIVPSASLNPTSANRLVIQNHTGEVAIVNATGNTYGFNIDVPYTTLTGFTVYGATSDNIYIQETDNIISYNKSYNASAAGINASFNSVIKNNLCYNNATHGIHILISNGAVIENNTVYGNGNSVPGSETSSTYSFSGSVTVSDLTSVYADINVPINQTITEIEVLGLNITHSTDSQLDIYIQHPDATEVELSTDNGANGNNYTNTNFDDDAATLITAGTVPFTGTYKPEGTLSSFIGKQSNGTWRLRVYDDASGTTGTLSSWQIKIYYLLPDVITGSGIYVESGTPTVIKNNIAYAKTGNANYYALNTGGNTLTSSFNNYYTTDAGAAPIYNGAAAVTVAAFGGASDISSDPLFVNATTDFHLKSTAGSYNGGAWPPTSASGGTWTNDLSLNSPSIDKATGTVANEPVPNGGFVNQGCYGNTLQASKTAVACTPPTITLGSNPSVCQGTTTADLTYSATTQTPDQYSIDFDVTAEGQGFADVTLAALPASPIVITVPGGAAAGTYNANLTVTRSSESCNSVNYTITITVNATNAVSVSIAADANPTCAGSSVTYTATPTNGGTPTYQWKKGGVDISGATNSTYTYTPVNGDVITCVMTSNATCASPTTATSNQIDMIVNPLPTAPTSVTATPSTIASGESSVLSYSGGSGDSFVWYSGSCGGTVVTSPVSPTSTTTYYGAWTNGCGTSTCQSVTVTVTGASGYTVSGYLKYDNTAQTVLNNETVELKNTVPAVVATATTNAGGYYEFTNIADGTYSVSPNVALAWSGVTSMDVTVYKKHIGGITLLSGLKLTAGNVNADGALNTADMTLILQRIATMISSFAAGNWAYSDGALTVSGANVSKDVQAICYGDGNTSYFGGTKSFETIPVENIGTILADEGDYFEIPVNLKTQISDLSSVTLVIPFNTEEFEIIGVSMAHNNNEMLFNVSDGVLRIMFSTLNASDYEIDDNLLVIKGYVGQLSGETALSANIHGEFGDYNDNVISNITFGMPSFSPSTSSIEKLEDQIVLYPNPANSFINVTNVKNSVIEIYTITGNKVITVASNNITEKINIEKLAAGTYYFKISKNNDIAIRKFTVVK